jgi:cytidylate kinase
VVLIIAIDGPSAAGKGTLAKALARAFDLPYLDTGLLYRAVGRMVLDAGADPRDPQAAAAAARALRPEDTERADLRGAEADAAASAVATIPGVRAALLDFQRDFARAQGAVLDGRDIGTVIFPDATAKLFVTASPEERARRRWLERRGRGEEVELDQVRAEMAERDARDASREAAPTRRAVDAVELDTTVLDAQAALDQAIAIVRKTLAKSDQTR